MIINGKNGCPGADYFKFHAIVAVANQAKPSPRGESF